MKPLHYEPEIIVRDGKPISVIIPFEEYRGILEMLEMAEPLDETDSPSSTSTNGGSIEESAFLESGSNRVTGTEFLQRWESIRHLDAEDAESFAETLPTSRSELSHPKSPWD